MHDLMIGDASTADKIGDHDAGLVEAQDLCIGASIDVEELDFLEGNVGLFEVQHCVSTGDRKLPMLHPCKTRPK